ncbi:MAG: selenide, water dikinase SelD [Deltaproteobacteria bacterium]|nr:selenide, water dikinase SelD [Deltaproteobacteria bacterium]
MQVLHQLPVTKDKDLLVGIETADDAGVYRLSDDTAVISTVDFFPPIVDDPFTFGEIAAANALSDVYAMGGSPRLAMNIVCFPKELPHEVLNEILKGSLAKLNEAGVLLVGGHSIEDSEVKYGLSITGFSHPDKIITNSGARPGDALILTKPLGTGVVTSAIKAGKIREEDAEAVFDSMRTLNRHASACMVEFGASGCTDITGYGLVGHAMEMAKGSGVSIIIDAPSVRVFPDALKFVTKKSCRPRTLLTNREYLRPDVEVGASVREELELVLYDPQTSGGLLIAIREEEATAFIEKLREKVDAFRVGSVVAKSRVRIHIE